MYNGLKFSINSSSHSRISVMQTKNANSAYYTGILYKPLIQNHQSSMYNLHTK